jgi:hypothetical protein
VTRRPSRPTARRTRPPWSNCDEPSCHRWHSYIPADLVAVGQQVTTKILRIDMVREQVSATLVL